MDSSSDTWQHTPLRKRAAAPDARRVASASPVGRSRSVGRPRPIPFSLLSLAGTPQGQAIPSRFAGAQPASSGRSRGARFPPPPAEDVGNVAGGVPPDHLTSRKNRVCVGIRCRPPFEDEADPSDPDRFVSQVYITPHRRPGSKKPPRLGKVKVLGHGPKEREFVFDFAFGPKVRKADFLVSLVYSIVSNTA
jgi:hypothetical protein